LQVICLPMQTLCQPFIRMICSFFYSYEVFLSLALMKDLFFI
jgi:hypothetical protein